MSRKRTPYKLFYEVIRPAGESRLALRRSGEAAEELKQHGSRAVEVILNQFFALREKNSKFPADIESHSIVYLFKVMSEVAEPRSAASIAAMLAWPEIFSLNKTAFHLLLVTVERLEAIHLLPYRDALRHVECELAGQPSLSAVERAIKDRVGSILSTLERCCTKRSATFL